MAAHRYWRLKLISYGGDAFGMAEVQFRTTPGVSLPFSGGTAFASSIYSSSFNETDASDGNLATCWISASQVDPQFWGYDYGAGGGLDVVEVVIYPRQNDPGQRLRDFLVQFSDDYLAWTTAWPDRAFFDGSNTPQTFTKPVLFPSSPHRHWRLLLKSVPSEQNYGLGAMQFRTAAGVPLLFSGGTVSATPGQRSGQPPEAYDTSNLVDDNPATLWASNNVQPGIWVSYDYGAGQTPAIAEVTLTSRADGYADQAVTLFEVQNSDDRIAWAGVWTAQTAPWSVGQTQTFTNPAGVSTPPPGPSSATKASQAFMEGVAASAAPSAAGAQAVMEVTAQNLVVAQGFAAGAAAEAVAANPALPAVAAQAFAELVASTFLAPTPPAVTMPALGVGERYQLGADDFARLMSNLLPSGDAWPTEADSVQCQTLLALAPAFARLNARANELVDEAFPGTTAELLPQWEASLGLPDACSPLAATVPQRRAAVVAKLIALGGSSIPYLTAFAAALGYAVTIDEYSAFRAGLNAAGDAANDDAWSYVWRVNVPYEVGWTPFLAYSSRADEPLDGYRQTELECRLRAIKPAQTRLLFAGPGAP